MTLRTAKVERHTRTRHTSIHACNLQVLKRYLFLLLAAAVMLITIQPPLPIRGGARCPRLPFHLCPRLWDETHVPVHAVDDVNLYAEGLSWREHWALWLLMGAIVLGVLAASVSPRAPPLLSL
jgi:hypothetical protein